MSTGLSDCPEKYQATLFVPTIPATFTGLVNREDVKPLTARVRSKLERDLLLVAG